VIDAAFDWSQENLVKTDPYEVRPLDLTKDLIMADGNTAAALGAIYGGVQFTSWYPITPATSLPEQLSVHIQKLRREAPDGGKTYAIIQAEDELAAIGMAVGAGWAGLRAMTSTSGPGISLMTEFVGLAYYAEIPVVIWDIQRVGPSTGLPTRTSQGDLLMVNFLGHGDTQHVVLLPASAKECFEFGWRSFDIADRLQSPVFVLSDLDLGMNQWMTEPFEYPDVPMDRGKVLWEEDIEHLTERWGRYLDVDGDGIPYRTIPGNRSPLSPWFARGTGHDEYARYSEDSENWESMMARIVKKYRNAPKFLPKPEIDSMRSARIGLIAYGSTHPAVEEARHLLKDAGVKTNYMRLRSVPFDAQVGKFIQKNDMNYVVELNRDGQMHKLLLLEYPELNDKLHSLPKHDGMSLSASWVADAVIAQEKN
jgi:2-oxoglutarate ferredoxin oxidoreductase subunit alpha